MSLYDPPLYIPWLPNIFFWSLSYMGLPGMAHFHHYKSAFFGFGLDRKAALLMKLILFFWIIWQNNFFWSTKRMNNQNMPFFFFLLYSHNVYTNISFERYYYDLPTASIYLGTGFLWTTPFPVPLLLFLLSLFFVTSLAAVLFIPLGLPFGGPPSGTSRESRRCWQMPTWQRPWGVSNFLISHYFSVLFIANQI